MKRWGLSLVLLVGVVAGCQSASPATGPTGLRVRVIAEPKQGVPVASEQVPVFDAPTHYQNGAFEKLDYGTLDNIVVWADPVLASDIVTTPMPETVNVGGAAGGDGLILAACVKQELILFNRGSRTLNLYSVSDGNGFDLGSVAPGKQGSYIIQSPGLMEILSDSSEQPLARVYAVPSPFVAVTHSGAEVTFAHLPPGDYRVCSWHPRLPGSVIAVHLSAGQTQSATVTVGVNSLPKVYAH